MKDKKIIIVILAVIGLIFAFCGYQFIAAPKTEQPASGVSTELDNQKSNPNIKADAKDEKLMPQGTGSSGEVPKCCEEE